MAFEDTALLYLAATLGAGLVVYVAAEIFNTLVSTRAINSITNTTSVGINTILAMHTLSTASNHSQASQTIVAQQPQLPAAAAKTP